MSEESLRVVIEEAHVDWHNVHQSQPFAVLLLVRLAEHGFAIHHRDPPPGDHVVMAERGTPGSCAES